MSIYVKKLEGGKLEVISGHMQLKAMLNEHSKADVVDIQTGEQLEVHEVGDALLAVNEAARAALQYATDAVIFNAASL